MEQMKYVTLGFDFSLLNPFKEIMDGKIVDVPHDGAMDEAVVHSHQSTKHRVVEQSAGMRNGTKPLSHDVIEARSDYAVDQHELFPSWGHGPHRFVGDGGVRVARGGWGWHTWGGGAAQRVREEGVM
ncbi:hypothetical protein VNO78_23713 [Psophocarpus tetragonolobus]|uniref:Uncharacterized protein n=1 Tax=Psophocarpus tetragonolobus TaxID=3891 RepID=A0AAN9S5B2_PSOTE